MRPQLVPLVALLPVLLAAAPAAGSDPGLLSGELQALRTALDAELAGTDHRRVEVGRQLRLRRDSRDVRRRALDELRTALPAATPELVESFLKRNRRRFDLWHDARLRLGERADRNSFLVAAPNQTHVQFARAGGDTSGERVLVYLELRPYEGAERLRGIFRVLERAGGSWRLVGDGHSFATGGPGER